MDFATYQAEARKTDQNPRSEKGRLISLLGLASEAADLLGEYKKKLRDGKSHLTFRDVLREELGDVLWYLSTSATKYGLSLEDLAVQNLHKTRRRWLRRRSAKHNFDERDLFDCDFPEEQQLPRQFWVRVIQMKQGRKTSVKLLVEKEVVGKLKKAPEELDGLYVVGSELTDNSHTDDGYRFHDVFHLAHAAVLGWSPVLRMLLGRKRKADHIVDEVEDGARAIFTEEALLTVVFDYARRHRFLKNVRSLDTPLLDMIGSMVSGLEVRHSPPAEWEQAIIGGYAVWRQVLGNGGGLVHVNLPERSLSYTRGA